MKNAFYLIVGILVIIGSFYLFLQNPAPKSIEREELVTIERIETGSALKIGDETIPVELANTPEERTRGLSGREALEEGTGLLFIFDTPAKYGFWMKDMKFPIDIVWIDADWIVVSIDRNVQPDSHPEIFYPKEPAKYVLEVPAGFAEEKRIDTGSQVYLIGQN